MRRVLLIAAALGLVAACGKTVDEYATLADARAAGVFEAGILPPILPASSALLRVVDKNQPGEAEGWFHFPSQDWAPLAAQLAPFTSAASTDPAVATWIAKNQTRGYIAYQYEAGAARWLLVCSESGGKCYFKRWAK